MWRRSTLGLARISRLSSGSNSSRCLTNLRYVRKRVQLRQPTHHVLFFCLCLQASQTIQPDLSLIHIDPMVVEWDPPKDWTTYTYSTKITELGDTLIALSEDDRYILKRYLHVQLDDKDTGTRPRQVVYQQVAAPAQAEAAKPAEEEKPKEKTSFKLVLTAVTEDAKIKVLKEVRVLKPGMKLLEVSL